MQDELLAKLPTLNQQFSTSDNDFRRTSQRRLCSYDNLTYTNRVGAKHKAEDRYGDTPRMIVEPTVAETWAQLEDERSVPTMNDEHPYTSSRSRFPLRRANIQKLAECADIFVTGTPKAGNRAKDAAKASLKGVSKIELVSLSVCSCSF